MPCGIIFLKIINFFSGQEVIIITDSIAKYVTVPNSEMVIIPGATIGQITSYISQRKRTLNLFDKIIVHVGTNDIHKFTEDQFRAAYCNLISLLKQTCPQSLVAMSAIIPRYVDYDKTFKKTVSVNSILSKLCQYFQIEYFASYSYLVKYGAVRSELYAVNDGGLHLNYEGSRLLGLYFLRRLAHMKKM